MNREFPWPNPFTAIANSVPDSDRFSMVPSSRIAPASGHLNSRGLEFFDDDGFGKGGARPLLKGRQRHHRIHIGLRFRLERNRIGAKAMHHRREHGVGGAKAAEQEWPEFSVSRAAPGPD